VDGTFGMTPACRSDAGLVVGSGKDTQDSAVCHLLQVAEGVVKLDQAVRQ
jgi:hypothetical protein